MIEIPARSRTSSACARSVLGGFLALCLLVSSLPVRADPAPALPAKGLPPALQDVGIDQKLNQQIPLDSTLRDETGQPVRLGQYFGDKPVILTLVYYECPMLCTLVLNGLVSSLRTLEFDVGKDFQVVTVSINPRDTPELAAAKKKTYLDEYRRPGAEKGWHFLTGDEATVKRLAESVGFRYKYDPARGEYAHAAAIMVLTPGGRLARYFYGVEYPPRDLRLGLVEAGQNRIGSAVDQALLFCYQYDPSTGRYSAAVMKLLRVAGALTVLALLSFFLLMWRRDVKRRHREAHA